MVEVERELGKAYKLLGEIVLYKSYCEINSFWSDFFDVLQ